MVGCTTSFGVVLTWELEILAEGGGGSFTLSSGLGGSSKFITAG